MTVRDPAPRRSGVPRSAEVFAEALRLGLTSFGGPVAHLAAFRRRYVTTLGWLDEATFADLVALGQALPGPTSSKVGMAIGWLRAGPAGGLAAWLGFTLPSALVMLVLGLGLGRASLADPRVAGLVDGLQVAAVGIVAAAVLGMARTLTPDLPRIVLAALAAAIALVVPLGLAPLVVVGLGALAGAALLRGVVGRTADGGPGTDAAARLHVGRRVAIAALAGFAALVLLPPLTLAAGAGGLVELAWAHIRAGTLVFGGAHVVLPLLESSVVGPGWLDRETFLAGYGAVQAMPGPLFTIAAYVGASASTAPDPWSGALVALIAIFLPGLLVMVAVLPAWRRLRSAPRARAALAGVNAAVVGLLAAALVTPVATSALRDPADLVLAAAAFVATASGRVPVLLVVGACAALGAVSY